MKTQEKILVSVCCITYNHEKFIKKCLEGFLIQNYSFNVEFIIHDDASIDNTQELIKTLVGNDKRFKLILRNKNLKSKGYSIFPILYKKAIGKYIAICEGDDYWTDPNKLQRQVEFLEQNPDCSCSFHAAKHQKNNNYKIKKNSFLSVEKKYSIKDAILGGGSFITTNSLVFKRELIYNSPKWIEDCPVGDLPLVLILATKGRIGYINEVMSVYNIRTKGSWSSSMNENKLKNKNHFDNMLKMWSDFDKWTNYRYHHWIFF